MEIISGSDPASQQAGYFEWGRLINLLRKTKQRDLVCPFTILYSSYLDNLCLHADYLCP